MPPLPFPPCLHWRSQPSRAGPVSVGEHSLSPITLPCSPSPTWPTHRLRKPTGSCDLLSSFQRISPALLFPALQKGVPYPGYLVMVLANLLWSSIPLLGGPGNPLSKPLIESFLGTSVYSFLFHFAPYQWVLDLMSQYRYFRQCQALLGKLVMCKCVIHCSLYAVGSIK